MNSIASVTSLFIVTLLPIFLPIIVEFTGGEFQLNGYGMLMTITYYLALSMLFVYRSTRVKINILIAAIVYIIFAGVAPAFASFIVSDLHHLDPYADEKTELCVAYLGLALAWLPCGFLVLKYNTLFRVFAYPALFAVAAIILLVYYPMSTRCH